MFSVLLSVYEKENPQYLDEALYSIWDSQTVKPNQIVLVKDGPLTEALDVCINAWQEKLGDTLTIVPLEQNVGLAIALNNGLQHCRYELVARMDTDDISLPTRFEKQLAFMENHPDIAASSAALEEWNGVLQRKIGDRMLPQNPDELEKYAKNRSPLSHPVTMYRKSAVLSVGGYPSFKKSQDYALWSLLLVHGNKLANLPDVLLKMRSGRNLMARRGFTYFKNEVTILNYQREIGFISIGEYIWNIMFRFIIRVAPKPIKLILYKFR
jgi:glycosyltransferase involved in cell wall biosynthesis